MEILQHILNSELFESKIKQTLNLLKYSSNSFMCQQLKHKCCNLLNECNKRQIKHFETLENYINIMKFKNLFEFNNRVQGYHQPVIYYLLNIC